MERVVQWRTVSTGNQRNNSVYIRFKIAIIAYLRGDPSYMVTPRMVREIHTQSVHTDNKMNVVCIFSSQVW